MQVTITEYKRNRTLEQNAYLWGVVYPAIRKHVLESTGDNYTSEEVHEWIKETFLDGTPKQVMGKYVVVRSTKKLSTKEFSELKERIQHYFAEQDLIIQDPVSNYEA